MKDISESKAIADSRLTSFLQKQIEKFQPHEPKLKKFARCGSQRVFAAPAIFLVTNNEHSRFYGLARCHSSWGCPTCTAKRMAEYGARIACAIDALKQRFNMSAFMMTFTIPHGRWMKIQDTYEILQNTWRAFTKESARSHTIHKYVLKKNIGEDGRAVGKAGDIKIYNKHLRAPFPNMRAELEITHNVRVYEFTWSPINGWHPHIHALYWLPDKNFDKLNDGWEDKLADEWWNIAKRETLKYFNKKFPDQTEANLSVTNSLFNEIRRTPKTGHKVVYFSKDSTGKVKRTTSSHYISGWGGDMELTKQRNEKQAHEGHYSPHQILQEAYEHPEDTTWINLYFDYLKMTFGHRRVQFSQRTGINKIVKDWQQTNQWLEVLKKKFMDKATAKWKVVCWFTDEHWSQISFLHLQTKILELSYKPDAKELIRDFLLEYSIKLPPNKHWFEQFIEKETYENKLLGLAG